LANHFAARGVKVDVVSRQDALTHSILGRLSPEVGVQPLRASGKGIIFLELLRYVLWSRPQALLSLDTRANLLASWLKFIPFSVPGVWANICNAVYPSGDPGKSGDARKLRKVYHRVDGVIAVSRALAQQFTSAVGDATRRPHVVYNPVITDELVEQAEGPVPHPWLRQGMPPVILGVGRLMEQKDFRTLLQAFARVREERKCRLVILGEGGQRQELQGLAERLGVAEEVDLHGFVENPYPYMRGASVYALSSAWEGLPNVLIEALGVGTPVVATDCPTGPREILEDGRYGPLVDVGDVEGMADALMQTLKDPLPPEDLKRGGERFRLETCGDHYLEVMGLKALNSGKELLRTP
jgi:glycosyltransferase involved in cell wall biosynthesis